MNTALPLSVGNKYKQTYTNNLNTLTSNNTRTILFAGDQRIEHGLKSFYGPTISTDDLTAEHYFRIANKSKISAFATHLGLINLYGPYYPNINYVVKLNSITSLVKENCGYVQSKNLCSVFDVIETREYTELNIVGVGYTIYTGIKDEPSILKEAQKNILQAHKYGLPVILWIYPKPNKSQEDSLENVASAVMLGEALGADFIKVKAPVKKGKKEEDLVKIVTQAGTKTRVLISGGSVISEHKFTMQAYKNVYTGGAFGIAVGRNIHQKPLHQAVEFCNQIYNAVVEGQEPGFDTENTGVRSII